MSVAEVAPSPLRIQLLGPLDVQLGGRPLPRLRSRKGHEILGLLILRRGRDIERDWLAGTLWPESPATRALANLRASLFDLRRALGPEARRLCSPTLQTLALDLSDAWVDLPLFDAAIGRSDPASLEEATELYRGPLMEGCVEEWILPERERRELAYLGALETLAARACEQKDRVAAERYLRRVVRTDPLRESACRDLMQLLTEAGNPAGAVAVYRELREHLDATLRMEPDAVTTDLFQRLRLEARARAGQPLSDIDRGLQLGLRTSKRVLRVGPRAAPSAHPVPPLVERPSPPNIPLPVDRLFGREEEIASLAALLLTEGARLVTLTGCGGVGKTRLALALIERMPPSFAADRDTMCLHPWFVALSDIPSEADRQGGSPAPGIIEAIRDAIGLPRVREIEPVEQVAEALSRRPSLLVLDNFEHLLPHGAGSVQALQARVPTLRCLVTSRHRLDLPGEREFIVSPLPVPADRRDKETLSLPSVQLFVDRAQAVRPDFQLTASNAAAVAEVCDRLEGIPLAIELAAARTQVLSPAQILSRLTERLDLAARQHRFASRHRSLRATLDWSYHLLTPELQAAFARLSVFRGGFDIEAAEALWFTPKPEPALDTLDILEQLREWSLIVVEDTGPECRYRLLETLREYAEERLHDAGQMRAASRRHQEHFIDRVGRAEMGLKGPTQREWMSRLERDHENFRVAITSLLECEGQAAAEHLLGERTWFLTWFWWGLGYGREGHRWLTDRLVALRGGPASGADALLRRARALSGAGFLFSFCEVDFPLARTLLEESLSLLRELGDEPEIAKALARLAYAVGPIEGEARCRSLYDESLALHRRLGDRRGVAVALTGLGSVAYRQGEYDRARSYLCEGLALCRELGDDYYAMGLLSILGLVARHTGDLDEARARFEESLQICRWFDNEAMIASELGNLGLVAQDLGDTVTARRLHEESLATMRRFRLKHGVACALNDLGNVALAEGDLAEARRLHEESLSMWRAMQNNGEIAVSLCNLGNVLLAQGEPVRADAHFREALALRREQGSRRGIADSLEGLAQAAAVAARAPSAAVLFGAAAALRESLGAPLPPSARAAHERALAGVRTALGDDRFAAAWDRGRALSVEDAMREALGDSPMSLPEPATLSGS